MKPISKWKLSTKTWTLRDMLASEEIKKGPKSPTFAHAIYDLIKGRVDDPDVSSEDIKNLTSNDICTISSKIAEKMIENFRTEIAISRMASMVNDIYKDSKPS